MVNANTREESVPVHLVDFRSGCKMSELEDAQSRCGKGCQEPNSSMTSQLEHDGSVCA